MEEVRQGLPVDVPRVGRQRRVDVGMGINPQDAQLSQSSSMTMNRADSQTAKAEQAFE